MSKRWLGVVCCLVIVLWCVGVFFVLSALVKQHQRITVLQRTPNCALVDEALSAHPPRVPDPKVLSACEQSARGLIESLSPADLARLRPAKPEQ